MTTHRHQTHNTWSQTRRARWGQIKWTFPNVVPDAKQVMSDMHRVCTPGGTVSVLVPSTGFTDEDLGTLIETLGLSGFSEAAITKWHRGPPKTSGVQLETLFRSVDLEPINTREYLDGMLMAATAPARSN